MTEFHQPKRYDPASGVTEEVWYDDRDRKVHVRRTADVEYVLQQNKIQIASSPRDFHKTDGLYHKARIPAMTIEKWLREDGFNWFRSTDSERRAKLNQHPELHVRAGKL